MNKVVFLTKKVIYFFNFAFKILLQLIYGFKINKNTIYFYFEATKFLHLISFLKNNSVFRFEKLADILVVDFPENLYRFEVTYVFWNMSYEFRFGLKMFTDGILPSYSLSNFYKSALWLEREIWDMYGLKYLFHQGLRRILSDYGFKGHPLRKDFPLSGYCDVYYDDSIQSIKIAPLELSQSLRFFKFENPWAKWYL